MSSTLEQLIASTKVTLETLRSSNNPDEAAIKLVEEAIKSMESARASLNPVTPSEQK